MDHDGSVFLPVEFDGLFVDFVVGGWAVAACGGLI
jgi:hypothetical protein